MTEDQEDLIEQIRLTNDGALQRLIRVMNLSDPVERFRMIDGLASLPSLEWAIPRAKALIINELRDPKGPNGSYKSVGELLGLSAQRVHQLANPEPRKAINNGADGNV